MKNSENKKLNIGFLICIIALLVLYIFDVKSKKKTNQETNTTPTPITTTTTTPITTPVLENPEDQEGFINPTPINTPRNVEIYKIDPKNNKITLTFKPPYPNILARQVIKYMIVIISYSNQELSDKVVEPFSSSSSDMSKFKIIDTKIIIKDKGDFKSLNAEHQQQGKLGIEFNMPEAKEGVFFKVGIAAIYKNLTSNVAGQTNYQSIFSLGSSFNYEENQTLVELGRECASQSSVILNEDDEAITSLPFTEEDTDTKYEQIKDQLLGGYPNNLILNEQTGADSLEYLIKQDLNNNVFNMNFKVREFDIERDRDLL